MPRKKPAGTSTKVTAQKQAPSKGGLGLDIPPLLKPDNMAEVKVIKKYFDTKFNCEQPIGNEFEVTEKRAKELVNAKVAEIVKIVCLKD